MAIQKTDGIVLKRQEVRETSLLLTVMTRDLGKIRGLVKGVRGARAAVPWYLEPLTLQSLVLYERRRSPWALISAFDLVDGFDPIRKDLVRTAYASLCLELVDGMAEPSDHQPELFDLLLATLRELSRGSPVREVVRAMQARMIRLSGHLPVVEALPLSAGAKLSLRDLLTVPLERILEVRLSRPVELELETFLRQRLRRILERELKTMRFLYALGLEKPLGVGGEWEGRNGK